MPSHLQTRLLVTLLPFMTGSPQPHFGNLGNVYIIKDRNKTSHVDCGKAALTC